MVRRELAIAIIAASSFACGSSRSDANDDATGATGGMATGGGAGIGGAAGVTGGSGGSGGDAGAPAGSGGSAGVAAGSGGSAGSTGGSAGAGAGPLGMCPGTTNHTAGTRLRPRFAVTSDGTRAWLGWQDTTLDIECSFTRAADGSERCLPNIWTTSEEVFTDDACTQAAYTPSLQDRCTEMPYLMFYVQAGCGMTSGYELYERGAGVPAGGMLFTFAAEDGVTCVPAPAPPAPLYRRGAAVPSTTFVGATTATVAGVGRIGGTITVGEDGVRQLRGWTDGDKDDTPCHMEPSEGGAQRCLPAGRRVNETFSDAACTLNALEFTDTCDAPVPAYATVYPTPFCPAAPYETRAVGAEFTGALYADGGDGTCSLLVQSAGSRLYETTPLPATDFQEVTEWVDMTAPGRLKPRYHTTTDGGCWFNDFWDTELMDSCWFTQIGDSEYRCVPGKFVSSSALYLDAACTTAIGAWEPATCGLGDAPRFVLGTDSSADACVDPNVVFEAEALSDPAYRLVAGTCTAVADTTGFLRFRAVDPSRLALGSVMVE